MLYEVITPLDEQKILSGVAVDAVIDSVSVKTTYKETLAEKGIIFCSISEAVVITSYSIHYTKLYDAMHIIIIWLYADALFLGQVKQTHVIIIVNIYIAK